MSIKPGNKIAQIVLTKYHQKKLAILVDRTGLSKTGVIQRLLENAIVFADEKEILEKEE